MKKRKPRQVLEHLSEPGRAAGDGRMHFLR
jgi:hypothetical protein